jgi:hypothetical protein
MGFQSTPALVELLSRSVDGGGLTTDLQTYNPGQNLDLWKSVGRPKYGDITLQVGMGMSKAFYGWIASFFKRDIVRKTGAIVGADFNYRERTRRTFSDALISEVQIPTLDGTSKDAVMMTVKIVPESMEYKTITDGPKLSAHEDRHGNKRWHASTFRFNIDGLGTAFARTTKIDQFSIKQQILEYQSGHRRTSTRIPGRIDIPTLNVYVPEVDAEKIVDQANARLITYQKPGAAGMTGTIELLSPSGQTLCTITLKGVDIVSAEPQKLDASAEAFALVKFQIQVEKMEFKYEG